MRFKTSGCRPMKMPHSGFRGERIEAQIPCLGVHRVDPLAVEGEADQAGSHPVRAPGPECDDAVVVSAAHAETPSLRVDADQGTTIMSESQRAPSAAAVRRGTRMP